MRSDGIIRTQCHARAGFIGNPSDGFYGKTIAVLVANWSARVTLWESPELVIAANPLHDPQSFCSLRDLHSTAQREGYYGGIRLLYATCKHFYDACLERGLLLHDANFTLRYETDIPRGLGLAGSSAIITATLRALMEFYGITEAMIGKPLLPNVVRQVETEELGLTAGLQDRVIQVYGGAVYMDFDKERMERDRHGLYVPLEVSLFPPMFIAMVRDPSDSSGMHSPVRHRWEQGDPEVHAAMRQWAELTEECRAALEARDTERIGELMCANFDLRRRIYGDAALGPANLRMIELGRAHGAPTKFSGSGGAIIGLYRDDAHFDELAAAYAAHGFRCVKWQRPPDPRHAGP